MSKTKIKALVLAPINASECISKLPNALKNLPGLPTIQLIDIIAQKNDMKSQGDIISTKLFEGVDYNLITKSETFDLAYDNGVRCIDEGHISISEADRRFDLAYLYYKYKNSTLTVDIIAVAYQLGVFRAELVKNQPALSLSPEKLEKYWENTEIAQKLSKGKYKDILLVSGYILRLIKDTWTVIFTPKDRAKVDALIVVMDLCDSKDQRNRDIIELFIEHTSLEKTVALNDDMGFSYFYSSKIMIPRYETFDNLLDNLDDIVAATKKEAEMHIIGYIGIWDYGKVSRYNENKKYKYSNKFYGLKDLLFNWKKKSELTAFANSKDKGYHMQHTTVNSFGHDASCEIYALVAPDDGKAKS